MAPSSTTAATMARIGPSDRTSLAAKASLMAVAVSMAAPSPVMAAPPIVIAGPYFWANTDAASSTLAFMASSFPAKVSVAAEACPAVTSARASIAVLPSLVLPVALSSSIPKGLRSLVLPL